MRKVVLYIATSLDGYIADTDGGINWLGGQDSNYAATDNSYADFIAGVDSVVMGYSTYKQVTTELSPGVWPYAGMQSYVLTHHQPAPMKDVQFVTKSVVDLIENLRQKSGNSIWIMGGASIVNPLIAANMIDEYHLSIMPYLLGDGIRLFNPHKQTLPLRLISTTATNGVIDCVYQRR
ncbi:riboflavin biosynthesis protein RibD [Lacticaseibacillus paracasei]|uniref:Riboflavin biosynthesis protein RibD n=1 Tax=Lacticaseibacillus paracasei TaxID=1597 RepID=A0ABD6VXW6_LACPA|nr:dihydrofolate reductase family protein [Lacticaseibacillus paracasei]POE40591.1 riboflavin biosynthesis protein RibD [Lacticaseibacillus paracasei]